MSKASLVALVAVAAFCAGASVAYLVSGIPWGTEMANQPSIKPQEQPLEPPIGSVPVTSRKRFPDHSGHHGHMAGMTMKNPVAATSASIDTGRELFAIYCAVCHGPEGKGGMPIAEKLPDIPTFTPRLLGRESDSHLFMMLTKGHAPMPGYAEALSPDERWHVINYLRSLQKK